VVTRRSGERHLSTGWLLSPRAVVTTARCVFDPASGWARNVEVIPGLDGSRRPHGSTTTERFETVQGWIDGGEQACDYGCLFLDDDGFPGLGHFGLAALSAPQPSGVVVNSAGYPSDDPRGTQWFDAGRVYGASDRSLRAGAGFATTAGSPVWLRAFSEGRWQRLVCAMVGSVEGRSLRLGGAALDNLKRWRASASPASVGLSPAAPPPPGP